MKLYTVSDLHNEFSKFIPPAISYQADVIVLAGDIYKGDKGIYWARKTWPDHPIIYVAGNHEFYGANRTEVLLALRVAALETNIHFLDNDEVIIDALNDEGKLESIRFLGCTLWTDFNLFGESQKDNAKTYSKAALNDFRVITEDTKANKQRAIFSPDDSIRLFEESCEFLDSKLVNGKLNPRQQVSSPKIIGDKSPLFERKTVVVTHHLPSMLSVAVQYKEDLLSTCFASHLDRLFGLCDLWIHGHTHTNFDYITNGTRVICNPRGYVTFAHGNENKDFDEGLIIEI